MKVGTIYKCIIVDLRLVKNEWIKSLLNLIKR